MQLVGRLRRRKAGLWQKTAGLDSLHGSMAGDKTAWDCARGTAGSGRIGLWQHNSRHGIGSQQGSAAQLDYYPASYSPFGVPVSFLLSASSANMLCVHTSSVHVLLPG
jgi:hypothetical protein